MTAPQEQTQTPEATQRLGVPSVFLELLINTLVAGVTSTFLWFALTFWVYLETRSVVATGVIGGAFSISSAVLGPVFGSFVDRHRKHTVLVVTLVASLVSFLVATAVFVSVPADELLRLRNPFFWVLVGSTLLGSVAGNMRGIALSTCVTLLIAEDRRDRANGMVGTVTGISFAITSVFSGLVIGGLGMGWAYYLTVLATVGALLHILTVRFAEPEPERDPDERPKFVEIRPALEAIRAVPGLGMLIALAAGNNLLTGVFMALMDAYGLELVSVQAWGLLWGFISLAFVAGGLLVTKFGLGSRPLRLILAGNLVNWIVCSLFTIRSSVVLIAIGMVIWLGLIPVIEAAEQTILQRAIPFERQGRVFGFAQLVENAASPLTAFLMAPLAESVFMPLMTDGRGADLIGGWFGTGPERGIALMFTISGVLGVLITVAAWLSRSYRRLSVVNTSSEGAPAPA